MNQVNQLEAIKLLKREYGIGHDDILYDKESIHALIGGSITIFSKDEYEGKTLDEFKKLARDRVRLIYLKKLAGR